MSEWLVLIGLQSYKKAIIQQGIHSLADLKAFTLSKDAAVQDKFDSCMEAAGMKVNQVSNLETFIKCDQEGLATMKKVLDESGFANRQQLLVTFVQHGVTNPADLKKCGEDRNRLSKIALDTKLSVKEMRRLQRGIDAWVKKNEQLIITIQLGADAMCEVFFSLRFSGGHDQRSNAKRVKEILDLRKVGGFLCAVGLGESFGEQIRKALFFCKVMVAFVEDHYGEDSGTKFTTYYELDYAFQYGKRIVPLRFSKDWPPNCNNCKNGQALTSQVFSPSMVYQDCQKGFDANKIADKIEAIVQEERRKV